MAHITFTKAEKKEKKYTIFQAIQAARLRLGNRSICTNALCDRSDNYPITLVELNEIADQIVDDTRYYG